MTSQTDKALQEAAHAAILRALDEASVRNETLRGMCVEVGLDAFNAVLASQTEAPAAVVEPVAWLWTGHNGHVQAFTSKPPPGMLADPQCQPLYLAPPAQPAQAPATSGYISTTQEPRLQWDDAPAQVTEPTQEEWRALLRDLTQHVSERGDHTDWSFGSGIVTLANRAHKLLAAYQPPKGQAGSFQARVHPWLLACFGEEIASDKAERNHRFLEEAIELVQACGCTASEAHQLVEYTFGRPAGEPGQEAGGVMVTLAALCLAQGLDMHEAGETELARVWTKVETIRAKQAAKPKHSPLPGPLMAQPQAQKGGEQT